MTGTPAPLRQLLLPMPMRTSLTMIVRNEEAALPECLGPVADLFDEIIVVDTGSTDRTREVAHKLGARVYDFPWIDDFAAARNESLRHATGDWIFWLDADDRLHPEDRRRLQALLAGLGDENVAWMMNCVCPLAGPGDTRTLVVSHCRLFRRHPEIRWQYRVHEQVLPSIQRLGGVMRYSDVVLHHVGYTDAATQRLKEERNLVLLERDARDHPHDAYVWFNLGWSYHLVGRSDAAIAALERGRRCLGPRTTYGPKLYALLVQKLFAAGRLEEGLRICLEGEAYAPGDPELLFQEASLRCELGDLGGAERCLLRLLQAPPGPVVGCLDPELTGCKARQNLAVVYMRMGRMAEAEAQLRALVAQWPEYTLAWRELAELWLAQGRWAELEGALARLAHDPKWSADAAVLAQEAAARRAAASR
ncbi:MAG: glycosyltransferase [Gemmataceae bacterium]|nr:glycosyltransferase [Gemmataceae bacterium]MDW8264871.1 glycosyltransferase [Gemmataceae bacterium]